MKKNMTDDDDEEREISNNPQIECHKLFITHSCTPGLCSMENDELLSYSQWDRDFGSNKRYST